MTSPGPVDISSRGIDYQEGLTDPLFLGIDQVQEVGKFVCIQAHERILSRKEKGPTLKSEATR